MTKKKSKHGGKRKNAGRKKKEPTKTIRVPLSKLDAVLKAIGKAGRSSAPAFFKGFGITANGFGLGEVAEPDA